MISNDLRSKTLPTQWSHCQTTCWMPCYRYRPVDPVVFS